MHDYDEQGRPQDCSYSCHICSDTGMTPGSDSCDCRCSLATERAQLNVFIAGLSGLPIGEIAWRVHRLAQRTANALAAGDKANLQHRLKNTEVARQLAEARAFDLSGQMADKDACIADLERQLAEAKAEVPNTVTCETCGDSGIVGRAPDDYFNCPDCPPAATQPSKKEE